MPKPEYGGDRTKQIPRNFKLYPADDELLNYIAQFLGSSRSDALRTAIRSFAAQLQQIRKDI